MDWLVLWNMIFLYCSITGKNNPIWCTPSFFRGVGQPPTQTIIGEWHGGLTRPVMISVLDLTCFNMVANISKTISHTLYQHTHTHTPTFMYIIHRIIITVKVVITMTKYAYMIIYVYIYITLIHTHTYISHTPPYFVHLIFFADANYRRPPASRRAPPRSGPRPAASDWPWPSPAAGNVVGWFLSHLVNMAG